MTVKKATKKATRKKSAPKVSKKVNVKKKAKAISAMDLKPADYNPRIMTDEANEGLNTSMDEFKDIAGITWNKTTGNIVTGHHRWKNICERFGIETITFEHLKGDRHAILANGEDTDFTLRIVEWDDKKEKMANITANSHAIEGKFTDGLNDLLAEIQIDVDVDLFDGLRLGELEVSVPKFDDDENWESDFEDLKDKIDKVEGDINGGDTVLKITCPFDMKTELQAFVIKAIAEEGFEGVKVG